MSPETRTKRSACNCNPDHMQSLLQVDDELNAEELHLELHHSEKWAGASSSQRHDSSSSELASSEQGQGTPKHALYEEQSNFGSDNEMGPLGSPAGPQSIGWESEPSSSEQGQGTPKRALREEQGNFGSDSEMGPSGFSAGPQSNGWGSDDDDGMGAPGFPVIHNRSMGMAAAQSDRQQQGHEEDEAEEDPSLSAQHMQQHQDRHPKHTRRGKRGGMVLQW